MGNNKSIFNKKIGKKIQNQREMQDITQDQLASLLGITRATMAKIELGTTSISLYNAIKLLKILNIDTDILNNCYFESELNPETKSKLKNSGIEEIIELQL